MFLLLNFKPHLTKVEEKMKDFLAYLANQNFTISTKEYLPPFDANVSRKCAQFQT